MSNKFAQQKDHGVGTTGHVWDEDLQELNNPLPRWWLWTFYATVIWGIGYTIAYPAWPLLKDSTAGLMGYSTRAEIAQDIAATDLANGRINEQLESVDLINISSNEDLNNYAIQKGSAVYQTWCAQCHGSGAAGAIGYPNLLDDDWLWGGDIESIHYTISHGIRNDMDDNAHYSQMPAFNELLEDDEIIKVVNYVQSLSGEPVNDPSKVTAGEVLYSENCSVCHGEAGEGDISQGAPNLSDAIWLYGGDYDTLIESIRYSRFGVMPPWVGRISEAKIRAVSVYVHQLGGGE